MSRAPMSVADLLSTVPNGSPSVVAQPDRGTWWSRLRRRRRPDPPSVSAPDERGATKDVQRLQDLTLLSSADSQVVVRPWVAEALSPRQGGAAARHDRAIAMRLRRIEANRGNYDNLTEVARHMAAVSRFDDLADLAGTVAAQVPGELVVAAFLGDVLPTFPRDHGSFLVLLDREREALSNTGDRAGATTRANELLAVSRARAESDPAMPIFSAPYQ